MRVGLPPSPEMQLEPPAPAPRRRLLPLLVGIVVGAVVMATAVWILASIHQPQVELVKVEGTIGMVNTDHGYFSMHPTDYGPATYMYTALLLHENLPGRQFIRPGNKVIVTVVDYGGVPVYVGRVDPVRGPG